MRVVASVKRFSIIGLAALSMLTGPELQPAHAADMSDLERAIRQAGFNFIYPPISSESAGLIYSTYKDANTGGTIRNPVCQYAYTNKTVDGQAVIASETYKRELSGGLKVTFLPEMASTVDLSAELKGGRITSYEVKIDEVVITNIPAGENRALTPSCSRYMLKDGKLRTDGGPYLAVMRSASTKSLTYKFNVSNNAKLEMALVVQKLAKLNANLEYKDAGVNELTITPKQGRFVFGWNERRLDSISVLGLTN